MCNGEDEISEFVLNVAFDIDYIDSYGICRADQYGAGYVGRNEVSGK